jgi:hypothetical protein
MGVEDDGIQAINCECCIDPEWPFGTWTEDQARERRCEAHKTEYLIFKLDGVITVQSTEIPAL